MISDFFSDVQNLISIISAGIGLYGVWYGVKKKKLNNFDLMQQNYETMIKHYRDLLKDLNKDESKNK